MEDISLFGRLRNKTTSGEVAGADQIKDAAFVLTDGTTNPTQSQINTELSQKNSFEKLTVLNKNNSVEIRPTYILFKDSSGNFMMQLNAEGLSFYNNFDLNNLGKFVGELDLTMFAYLKAIVDKMKEGYNIVFEKAESTSSDT